MDNDDDDDTMVMGEASLAGAERGEGHAMHAKRRKGVL
jgi:hypothetical protein